MRQAIDRMLDVVDYRGMSFVYTFLINYIPMDNNEG